MIKTLVVENFAGGLTDYQDGDINSGRTFSGTSAGASPFNSVGNLTWNNRATQIDVAGSVITDLIMAGKERVESGILYVYAIGHTGRLYKIQVNNPATYNADYDIPTLVTTIVSGSPTFTRGGFIDFFGATEKIYIGHDKGVTSVNFDGSGESAISGTWIQNVPRPLTQFIGKLYIGNGPNIAEIDSTGTVTSSTKLSPGFPSNTQVRDMDASPQGTYIQMVVSRLALPNILTAQQFVDGASSVDSYTFLWNGVDTGYTSFNTYPSFSLTSSKIFGDYTYLFGSDFWGTSVYAGGEKILATTGISSSMPNAVTSSGNLLFFLAPTYFNGVLEIDLMSWGSFSFEVGKPNTWYNTFFQNATSPETDIQLAPFLMPVSNLAWGPSSNGYADNISSTTKMYFSTLESSSAPTTAYRFYKWITSGVPGISNDNPLGQGAISSPYYQTQIQKFSKKVTIKQIRVYGEPWQSGAEFSIDIIGSSGSAMTNGSKTFTVGTNLTAGDDFAWWAPDVAPTYAIGLGLSNLGSTNHVINKVEIDYDIGGQ